MARVHPPEGTRRIESVDDVRSVIASGMGSFSEWLDCISVAKAASEWNLVATCALRALGAIDVNRVPPRSLEDAAREILRARFARTRSLKGVRRTAANLQEDLGAAVREPTLGPRAKRALEKQRELVNEMALLLADDSAPSYVTLCSRLRHVGRPDLGIQAASKAIRLDGESAPPLTTRGAAYLDLEDTRRASKDLERALEIEGSIHAKRALYRCRLAQGRHTEALRIAMEVADLEPSRWSALILAAAAFAANDTDMFEHARAMLEGFPQEDDEGPMPSRWVTVLAAREYVSLGQLDLARRALEELLDEGPYRPAEELRDEIRRAERRRPHTQ